MRVHGDIGIENTTRNGFSSGNGPTGMTVAGKQNIYLR